jgi:hypothetical protein
MKNKSIEEPRLLEVPGQGAVNMDSIGYIAYWREGRFVGVATVLPKLETEPVEHGYEALNLIKELIEREYRNQQAAVPAHA